MYRALLVLGAITTLFVMSPARAAVDGTVRVSVDANGNQLAGPSGALGTTPSLSASGGFVAFESLGPASGADGNGTSDVFYRDIEKSRTSLVSVTPDGVPGNNRSYAPSVSGDGRFVAFESMASNLVEGDTNVYPDIYLRDQTEGQTAWVSVSMDGKEADGPSGHPALSSDGNIVAFCSGATNLAPDDSNGVADVFVRDIGAAATQRILPPRATGAAAEGCERVALSGDGVLMAFSYRTDNGSRGAVSQVYLTDRRSGETKLLSAAEDAVGNGASGVNGLAVSVTGDVVLFDSVASDLVIDDGNSLTDVFAWEAQTDTVSRISLATDGSELNGDSGQLGLNMSADGRFVVYASNASNVVPADGNVATDIFRLDRTTNEVTIASVDAGDRAGNGPSYSPDINDAGDTVSFVSLATSLIYGDRNRHPDVFVRGTVFPASGGMEGEAIPTPAPDDTVDLPKAAPEKDEETPILLIIGGIAGAILLVLVASWFLLGRSTKA